MNVLEWRLFYSVLTLVTAVAVAWGGSSLVVTASIANNSSGSSSTGRSAKGLGNIADLLLKSTYVTVQLGQMPPDHPLIKYPPPIQMGAGKKNDKLLVAIPGMNGRRRSDQDGNSTESSLINGVPSILAAASSSLSYTELQERSDQAAAQERSDVEPQTPTLPETDPLKPALKHMPGTLYISGGAEGEDEVIHPAQSRVENEKAGTSGSAELAALEEAADDLQKRIAVKLSASNDQHRANQRAAAVKKRPSLTPTYAQSLKLAPIYRKRPPFKLSPTFHQPHNKVAPAYRRRFRPPITTLRPFRPISTTEEPRQPVASAEQENNVGLSQPPNSAEAKKPSEQEAPLKSQQVKDQVVHLAQPQSLQNLAQGPPVVLAEPDASLTPPRQGGSQGGRPNSNEIPLTNDLLSVLPPATPNEVSVNYEPPPETSFKYTQVEQVFLTYPPPLEESAKHKMPDVSLTYPPPLELSLKGTAPEISITYPTPLEMPGKVETPKISLTYPPPLRESMEQPTAQVSLTTESPREPLFKPQVSPVYDKPRDQSGERSKPQLVSLVYEHPSGPGNVAPGDKGKIQNVPEKLPALSAEGLPVYHPEPLDLQQAGSHTYENIAPIELPRWSDVKPEQMGDTLSFEPPLRPNGAKAPPPPPLPQPPSLKRPQHQQRNPSRPIWTVPKHHLKENKPVPQPPPSRPMKPPQLPRRRPAEMKKPKTGRRPIRKPVKKSPLKGPARPVGHPSFAMMAPSTRRFRRMRQRND